MPQRLKRKNQRAKKPEGSAVVTRISRWGNPYKVIGQGGEYTVEEAVSKYLVHLALCIKEDPEWYDLNLLKGKDLLCSCPLDQPCHADILLELAND